jgi:hypothetical protein
MTIRLSDAARNAAADAVAGLVDAGPGSGLTGTITMPAS